MSNIPLKILMSFKKALKNLSLVKSHCKGKTHNLESKNIAIYFHEI
jgi:hypothetical protein